MKEKKRYIIIEKTSGKIMSIGVIPPLHPRANKNLKIEGVAMAADCVGCKLFELRIRV